jgi:hypothetical protein
MFTVDGKRWAIVHEDYEGAWGWCDHVNRTISLHTLFRNARSRHSLEILIHEVLHACLPEESEKVVNDRAKVISGVLWGWGWRRKLASVKGQRKCRPRRLERKR